MRFLKLFIILFIIISFFMPGLLGSQEPCTDNSQCEVNEYCRKKEEDCNGIGVCVENADIMCTTEWEPICGCDGKTYSNACSATSAGMNIAYSGECGKNDEVDDNKNDHDEEDSGCFIPSITSSP